MGRMGRCGIGESRIVDLFLMNRGLGAKSECRSGVSSFKRRRSSWLDFPPRSNSSVVDQQEIY